MSEIKHQWEKRVNLFQYIFSCLFRNNSSEEIRANALEIFEFDADYLKCIEYYADHKEDIVKLLISNISQEWSWNNISFHDKAILIATVCESNVLKIAKIIMIDQAIITSKNFGIDDNPAYKFINAILEKVLK